MKVKFVFSFLVLIIVLLALAGCQKRSVIVTDQPITQAEKDYTRPLPPGQLALRKITDPAQIPDYTKACSDLNGLKEAIARSINYMSKPSSQKFYPYGEITHERAVKTLQELYKLVSMNPSPEEMNRILKEKFDTYISVGCDDQGTVLFTGYYTPIFNGSFTRTDLFKYPLYKQPADLIKDSEGNVLGQKIPGQEGKYKQYPGRKEIQKSNMLAGLELVWLADPFEAYIVHVQGSAKIRLPDGQIETVAYSAHNGWDYKSIRPKMLADRRLIENNVNMKKMIDYFKAHPDQVEMYTNENPRFVFFRSDKGDPRGSLNESVTPLRTIATDKSIYPRAMFTFSAVDLDKPIGFALDQDAGGAIRAAGRCDVYMGIGEGAGESAGKTYREGQLYYLFIKPDNNPTEK
ncbi:MAG: MltA domain-containing protein [Smithella sp.]